MVSTSRIQDEGWAQGQGGGAVGEGGVYRAHKQGEGVVSEHSGRETEQGTSYWGRVRQVYTTQWTRQRELSTSHRSRVRKWYATH